MDFKNILQAFYTRAITYNEEIKKVGKNYKVSNNGVSLHSNEKVYVNTVDPVTEKWITSKPYITKVHKITDSGNTKLVKMGLSYSFCDIFKNQGHDSESLMNIISKHSMCEDIFGFYSSRLKNKNLIEDSNAQNIMYAPYHTYFTDECNNKLNGTVIVLGQKYIKNGNVYNKSIIALLSENCKSFGA